MSTETLKNDKVNDESTSTDVILAETAKASVGALLISGLIYCLALLV